MNGEIEVACRNALGLNREKTLLTLGEFYAPSPDVASRATGGFPFLCCIFLKYRNMGAANYQAICILKADISLCQRIATEEKHPLQHD